MFRRLALLLAGILVLAVVAAVGSDRYVEQTATPHVFEEIDAVPQKRVAVVLGTAKYLVRGGTNPFYDNRIRAAAQLYETGHIEHVIVSGDNSTVHYNEPVRMQEDLMEAGIPADSITLDYAGFRTLDSMVRAAEVFGQNRFLVVSQCFHVERAVFIAREFGIDASGFCASDVDGAAGLRVRLRETLARAKAVLDVKVLGTRPKFLGEPVELDS
ncbi:MAG: ElyC/SanA/YdcF family protein [Bacteroidota bacterium]